MSKFVRIAFTGVAVVTPSPYRQVQRIEAVMPSSPRARFASNRKTQIDAQFTFAAFNHGYLVEDDEYRRPDFRYPNRKEPLKDLCILDHEVLMPHPAPKNQGITYKNDGPTSIYNAAIWDVFAAGGEAALKRNTTSPATGPFVRFESPVGELSSRFVCEPVKVNFNYGEQSPLRLVAHEIVVTLEYADDTPFFTLLSSPSGGPHAPQNMVFTWAEADDIDILIGNGSLHGVNMALARNCVAHEHESRTDREFEVIYDVVDVKKDPHGRVPVPTIEISEIRQIPCIATLV